LQNNCLNYTAARAISKETDQNYLNRQNINSYGSYLLSIPTNGEIKTNALRMREALNILQFLIRCRVCKPRIRHTAAMCLGSAFIELCVTQHSDNEFHLSTILLLIASFLISSLDFLLKIKK